MQLVAVPEQAPDQPAKTEPLRQAQKAGVPAPRMQRLCDVLTQLDANRAGLSPMQQQR